MMQQLRSWKTIIAVLMLLLAAEGAARTATVQRLFDPVDGSVAAARWRYASLAVEPDIVLMGDSRVVMDLSPNTIQSELARITGSEPTVVNIAVHGSSMEHNALFLSEIVLRSETPKLVVLNVSEVALNDAAWRNNPPAYLRGLAAPTAVDTWLTAGSRQAVWESLSALARLQHRLRLAIEGPWIRYWRGTERYDWGAMQWHGQMDAPGRAEQLEVYRGTYLADFEPNGTQMRYLESILEMARDHDIRLLLVLTPVTPEFLGAFPAPADAIRFKEAVSNAAAEHDVPLIDYYQLPGLTSEMFFDLHHTNSQGTQRFSTIVAQDVIAPALVNWEAFKIAQVPTSSGMIRPP